MNGCELPAYLATTGRTLRTPPSSQLFAVRVFSSFFSALRQPATHPSLNPISNSNPHASPTKAFASLPTVTMKYAAAAAALLVALARAQDVTSIISQIPSCALNCLSQGISSTDCSISDFTCICSQFDSIQASVQPCLASSQCSETQVADTLRLATGLCSNAGGASGSAAATTATVSASNIETIPVASDSASASASATETVTSTVASQTVIVSGSSTSTVGSNSTASAPTGSRTTTGSADATSSDAATETTAAGGDSAAGRVQAAGWAIAGVIAAAVAL
ncbi:hypothetical protein BN1723_002391 [Verticillium longisporum]|uniref:CFEM domain-containing protein n=1 Tax=Verticillium longisporum TaxID=100787 RepID=A0A0G4N062_VERLO|nr:hypothetical protein BN1723_002391 [Verticillium longisporum]CRK39807.1 hypothetical protein BN1708_008033 [Verticillium longisporum]